MNQKIKITIREHEWLDRSVSWFLEINGEKIEGEIFSKNKAIDEGKLLAQKLNGEFIENSHNTNEIFS